MEADRFNPLKILRWHNEITKAIAPGVHHESGSGPIRANLDLTNLCNHSCPWCEPAEYRAETVKDQKHTLNTAVAIEVLEDLASLDCKLVQFSGGGEPLLHHDFGIILEHAKELGMRTFIYTNGVKLGDWWHPYINASADHIRVSLDASNEAEHIVEHHAKPGDFKKILENIDFITRHKRTGRPELGVSYVLTKNNSGTASVVRTLGLAGENGFDYLQFRPVSYSSQSQEDVDALMVAANAANSLVEKLCPKTKVYVLGQRGSDVFHQRKFDKCYASLTLAVISATGDCCACCDERTKIFGNVYEHRFKDIWLSERHRKLANGIIPLACQRCVQCGFNAAVQRLIVGNEAHPEIL
jgi:MoaA/NifB/PqqE/SkfB family radical SAM enzyme